MNVLEKALLTLIFISACTGLISNFMTNSDDGDELSIYSFFVFMPSIMGLAIYEIWTRL